MFDRMIRKCLAKGEPLVTFAYVNSKRGQKELNEFKEEAKKHSNYQKYVKSACGGGEVKSFFL